MTLTGSAGIASNAPGPDPIKAGLTPFEAISWGAGKDPATSSLAANDGGTPCCATVIGTALGELLPARACTEPDCTPGKARISNFRTEPSAGKNLRTELS